MTVPNNITTTNDIDAALSQELVLNFQQDYDKLAEILGIFNVETMAAGTALFALLVHGELNNNAPSEQHPEYGSSGSGYVEGDLVALSKYTAQKEFVDVVKIRPYRKMTSADAILANGYERAVLRTDKQMLSQVRRAIISDFIDWYSDNSTAYAPTGGIAGLQEAIASTGAYLMAEMENNGDATDAPLVYFVNRMDVAAYLANANITTQTAFGMTYMQDFLGAQNVLATTLVSSGNIYVTSSDNIHAYGVDFGELSRGGLNYVTDASGLIGVAHRGAYDHVSAETNIASGLSLFPEVADYNIKATFTPDA